MTIELFRWGWAIVAALGLVASVAGLILAVRDMRPYWGKDAQAVPAALPARMLFAIAGGITNLQALFLAAGVRSLLAGGAVTSGPDWAAIGLAVWFTGTAASCTAYTLWYLWLRARFARIGGGRTLAQHLRAWIAARRARGKP